MASHRRGKPQQGKQRQVLKVVQIFNPTRITTDVASFRELVQELTGRNYQPSLRKLSPRSAKSAGVRFVDSSSRRIESHEDFGLSVKHQGVVDRQDSFSFLLDPSSPNWSEKSEGSSDCCLNGFEDLEMDVISELISQPLPDCTMLPPLIY